MEATRRETGWKAAQDVDRQNPRDASEYGIPTGGRGGDMGVRRPKHIETRR